MSPLLGVYRRFGSAVVPAAVRRYCEPVSPRVVPPRCPELVEPFCRLPVVPVPLRVDEDAVERDSCELEEVVRADELDPVEEEVRLDEEVDERFELDEAEREEERDEAEVDDELDVDDEPDEAVDCFEEDEVDDEAEAFAGESSGSPPFIRFRT